MFGCTKEYITNECVTKVYSIDFENDLLYNIYNAGLEDSFNDFMSKHLVEQTYYDDVYSLDPTITCLYFEDFSIKNITDKQVRGNLALSFKIKWELLTPGFSVHREEVTFSNFIAPVEIMFDDDLNYTYILNLNNLVYLWPLKIYGIKITNW